jgi:cysteine synthase B
MSILDLVGSTPFLELSQLSLFDEFPNVRVFTKLECYNYTGSVKARPVLWMLEEAEREGLLDRSLTILEPTSGNTGIALAGIARLKDYQVTLVMPKSMSQERRLLMQSYGANLMLTPEAEGTDGAIRKARELLHNNPRFVMLDQFSNPANIQAHFQTTGPEIWAQSNGKIDAFVAGMGTGGTLMGVGSFLRLQNPQVQIIGVEPHAQTPIPGLKNMSVSEVPKIFCEEQLATKIPIKKDSAIDFCRYLAREAALLVGPSSGAALAGVVQFLKQQKSQFKGTVVTLFPDNGMKYLSQSIFT